MNSQPRTATLRRAGVPACQLWYRPGASSAPQPEMSCKKVRCQEAFFPYRRDRTVCPETFLAYKRGRTACPEAFLAYKRDWTVCPETFLAYKRGRTACPEAFLAYKRDRTACPVKFFGRFSLSHVIMSPISDHQRRLAVQTAVFRMRESVENRKQAFSVGKMTAARMR